MAESLDPTTGVWVKAVKKVSKSIFRVEAGDAGGTGFAISTAQEKTGTTYALMVATAYHVLKDCGPDSPIRLFSPDGQCVIDRRTFEINIGRPNPDQYDIALIYVQSKTPFFDPHDVLPLLPKDFLGAIGADLGWLGFPSVVWPQLCFFRRSLSAYQPNPPAYLVDGVAINGVSGGPAFNDEGVVFGLVQCYIPNVRPEKMALPGLMGVVPVFLLDEWMSETLKAASIS